MKKPQQHTRITRRLAGRSGRTEVPIKGGRRADVRRGDIAMEVERSPSRQRIAKAIARLEAQSGVRRELRVPHPHLDKATEIARQRGTALTLKNLGGTKRRRVT